jgi:hypothetical protein
MDLPSQPGPRTPWTKVTKKKKKSRTTQEDSIGNAKHIKEDSHWLHSTTTHNLYTALLNDENIDHLMSALSQAIAPNPHINLLNVYIQIANKMGFQQKKIIPMPWLLVGLFGVLFVRYNLKNC